MPLNEEFIDLSPVQFEREVKSILQRANANLKEFKVKHLEKLQGTEGEYEIDITVRFEALGATYLTLVECKHQKNPIKREIVQILQDKIRTTGAHKGMIFATSTFQRGAIEYASAHGIALVRMIEGKTSYETKSLYGRPIEPPPWANIPSYVGYLCSLTKEGHIQNTLVSITYLDALNEFLNF